MARRKPSGQSRRPGNPRSSAGRHPESGELRIIGGDWRSRKLRFPAVGGVRPSPARTRETLFNWLAMPLPGARCLDLFAGSGALGLEALSRGAASVTLVDHTQALARALQDNLRLLDCTAGEVVCQDVQQFLAHRPAEPFDILFMDPPFRQGWLDTLLPLIEQQQWLKPGGWVYIEHERELTGMKVPESWQLYRQKTAGQVTYNLYRTTPEA
ncbi:MAG: 16S rRNA (guanine(966)-N(2))-methyltransferase RsmD [Alteromonadaceae bacterium]|nr:16S rRNA (guanine(966)-N(2))-methyltransferase RsmD [Alteromonadaceae bacterium]